MPVAFSPVERALRPRDGNPRGPFSPAVRRVRLGLDKPAGTGAGWSGDPFYGPLTKGGAHEDDRAMFGPGARRPDLGRGGPAGDDHARDAGHDGTGTRAPDQAGRLELNDRQMDGVKAGGVIGPNGRPLPQNAGQACGRAPFTCF